MTLTFESGMSVVLHNFLGKGCDCLIEDKCNIFEEGDMSGDGMAMTGGCLRTPDWMASGRQVKCAADGGGDVACMGGVWVEESLEERRHIAICRWERTGCGG